MAEIIVQIGALIQKTKLLIDSFTFLSRDVLHIYGGVAFFMLWYVLLKKRRQYLSLSLIFLIAVINEISDIFYYLDKTSTINWTESISDIFNTIFLPFALFVFLRFSEKQNVKKG